MAPRRRHRPILHWIHGFGVDLILDAHAQVSNSGVRSVAPTRKALLESAVVLMFAQLEACMEDLFEEAARHRYTGLRKSELSELFNATSKRLNGVTPAKINALFFNLGIPRIMNQISWPHWPASKVERQLLELSRARQAVAHGRRSRSDPRINRVAVKRWESLVLGTVLTVQQVLVTECGIVAI